MALKVSPGSTGPRWQIARGVVWRSGILKVVDLEGAAVDLTDATVRLYLGDSIENPPNFEALIGSGIEIVDAVKGWLQVDLSAIQTESLIEGWLVYELLVTAADGAIVLQLRGIGEVVRTLRSNLGDAVIEAGPDGLAELVDEAPELTGAVAATEVILISDPARAPDRRRKRKLKPLLDAKADAGDTTAALALKAPLASPALTGAPTAPTPATSDNSMRIATTAMVKAALAELVASSPAALDTLNELATALGNDANFAATMTSALAAKQNSILASGWGGPGTVELSLEDKLREQPAMPEHYGAVGDDIGYDDSAFAAMLAAVATSRRPILLQPRPYRLGNTSPLRLPDGVRIGGTSARQGYSTLKWYGSGAAMFDSDPNAYMSALDISGLEILCAVNSPGNIGTGDAIKLYGLCNNSLIDNVLIRNFPGNAITIAKQTLNPSDATACGNVLFSQVFVVSCGGYAFDVDGRVNAIWQMCDFNSCATGGYRFRSGISNQAQITIIGQWWEGTQPWSATNVIKFDNPSGQVLNLLGGTFQNDIAGSNRYLIDNVGAATPVINMKGVSRYGFDADYHDGVNSVTYNDGDRGIFSAHGSITGAALKAVSIGPTIDLFQNSGGTADQRRFRMSIAGNLLALTSRTDAGSASKTLLTLAHNSGAMNLPNATTLSINSVQALTTRRTGWTAATGTATRSTFATGSVTTAQLAEAVKALIDDLISHGLIGT